VEVEPSVVECAVFDPFKELSELLTYLLLTALLINQIHKVLFVVLCTGFLDVKFGSLVALVKILTHDDWGRPRHCRLH